MPYHNVTKRVQLWHERAIRALHAPYLSCCSESVFGVNRKRNRAARIRGRSKEEEEEEEAGFVRNGGGFAWDVYLPVWGVMREAGRDGMAYQTEHRGR